MKFTFLWEISMYKIMSYKFYEENSKRDVLM